MAKSDPALDRPGWQSADKRRVLNSGMTKRTQAAAARRADTVSRALAIELRHLREDCGLSQRALASIAGVPQSVISRVESSLEVPSIETYARLATGLGGDLSIRIYPNTGPAVRDRHQARIGEALVTMAAPGWTPFPEVGVRHPVRGWIDFVLVDRTSAVVLATEIESMPRRMEQVIRWSSAKAEALPSAPGYPFGARTTPAVHRLLIVRDTQANRTIGALFQASIKAAYPADPWHALAALRGETQWPGSAVLWARDQTKGRIELRPISGPIRSRAR